MLKYKVIIYWSEDDQAFIAEIPELPDCMADGSTKAEALQNAELIAVEWIEMAKSLGREIPQPARGPQRLTWCCASELNLPRPGHVKGSEVVLLRVQSWRADKKG